MNDLPRGRDSMGRFVDGNSGGPGRKPRKIEQEYMAVMEQVTNLDVWRKIVEQATIDAQLGDSKARTWISGYLLGQPISRVQEVEPEVDGMTALVEQVKEKMLAAQRDRDQE